MKSKKLLVLIPIAIIIIICSIIFIPKRKELSIKVGDSIGELKIENKNGETTKIKSCMPDKYVILYISSGCHPCIDELPSLQLLCETLSDSKCPVITIWRKSIPEKLANDRTYNFRLKNSEMASYTPCFFYVENNQVVFETQDLEKIVRKIVSSTNQNEIQKSFIDYCIKKNNVKKDTVYFLFVSDDADEKISNLPDDAEIITVSNENMINTIYDPHYTISYLFGITKYPSCVKCDTTTLEYEVLE